jgi:hypothetical protein
MWEHYKKTFVGIQTVIWLITAAILIATHSAVAALAFLAAMQIGSVTGAMWAWRLKNRLANQLVQPRRL